MDQQPHVRPRPLPGAVVAVAVAVAVAARDGGVAHSQGQPGRPRFRQGPPAQRLTANQQRWEQRRVWLTIGQRPPAQRLTANQQQQGGERDSLGQKHPYSTSSSSFSCSSFAATSQSLVPHAEYAAGAMLARSSGGGKLRVQPQRQPQHQHQQTQQRPGWGTQGVARWSNSQQGQGGGTQGVARWSSSQQRQLGADGAQRATHGPSKGVSEVSLESPTDPGGCALLRTLDRYQTALDQYSRTAATQVAERK
eukprot:CAMPEP_0198703238 /NCGR_PEP_ID=MMETSP1468-20131203/389227_1 /TAXON_ID=1461545 /ORGANISM="Mantoniella sp, Strain CCMP1436" /LENGTH=250 /DNA_ID=CAMNT_0044461903 /DNA_START=1481 /DNA_END=2234 /DNA_ORIENTATION=-